MATVEKHIGPLTFAPDEITRWPANKIVAGYMVYLFDDDSSQKCITNYPKVEPDGRVAPS